MNSKLLRPLIITAMLIAALGGVFALVNLFAGEPEPSESPSQPNILMVTNEDVMQLRRMSLDMKDKKNFEVTVDATATPRKYEVIPKFTGFDYNATRITLLTNAFTKLEAIELVQDNVTDLAQYGLASPSVKVTGEFKDGSRLVLLLGNELVTKAGYYAMVEGTGAVYAINTDDAETLLNGEPYLRDLTLMPPLPNDVSNTGVGVLVNRLTISKPGEEVIDIRRRTPEELMEYGVGASTFELLSPIPYNTSDVMVESKVIESLIQLKGIDHVEDNPTDLSKYGLDEPVEVYMVDNNNIEYNLLIGQKDDKAYLMKKGIPSVMTISPILLEFLKADEMDILFKLLWLYNIDMVSKVEYDLEGEKYTLEIDSDSEAKTFYATLNGEELSEDNGRRLFMRSLEFAIYDKLTVTYGGAPQYTISIHMESGDVHTLKLFRINDRHFAAELEGYASYIVHVNDIKYMLKGFEAIANGETMPTM